jgi:hypothetical protein
MFFTQYSPPLAPTSLREEQPAANMQVGVRQPGSVREIHELTQPQHTGPQALPPRTRPFPRTTHPRTGLQHPRCDFRRVYRHDLLPLLRSRRLPSRFHKHGRRYSRSFINPTLSLALRGLERGLLARGLRMGLLQSHQRTVQPGDHIRNVPRGKPALEQRSVHCRQPDASRNDSRRTGELRLPRQAQSRNTAGKRNIRRARLLHRSTAVRSLRLLSLHAGRRKAQRHLHRPHRNWPRALRRAARRRSFHGSLTQPGSLFRRRGRVSPFPRLPLDLLDRPFGRQSSRRRLLQGCEES